MSLTVLSLSGCASRTHVELASAQGRAVQPFDGADGQNEAAVVGAGVVEIDDLPPPVRTLPPDAADHNDDGTPTASTTSTASTASTGDDTEAAEGQPSPKAAAMIDELCSTDRRDLRIAVEGYRDEYGTAPTSEGELLATGFLRERSDVYDVRVDGSISPSDDTCAR